MCKSILRRLRWLVRKNRNLVVQTTEWTWSVWTYMVRNMRNVVKQLLSISITFTWKEASMKIATRFLDMLAKFTMLKFCLPSQTVMVPASSAAKPSIPSTCMYSVNTISVGTLTVPFLYLFFVHPFWNQAQSFRLLCHGSIKMEEMEVELERLKVCAFLQSFFFMIML